LDRLRRQRFDENPPQVAAKHFGPSAVAVVGLLEQQFPVLV
jgi:hypothetical protein